MYKAKLIVCEGCDASGKSTQIELIKKWLEKNNYKYTFIHFPMYGTNEASQVISAYLRGEYGDITKVNPIFAANMYAMDRFLYLPELQKCLIEDDVVLLDRYVFSNMAYQGAKYTSETQAKIMRDWIDDFEFGFLELPYPDLNIFFDVPVAYIEERLRSDKQRKDRKYLEGRQDIHEIDIDFQRRVRENYLNMKNYQGFKLIPCADEILSSESDVPELKLFSEEELFNRYVDFLEKAILIK